MKHDNCNCDLCRRIAERKLKLHVNPNPPEKKQEIIRGDYGIPIPTLDNPHVNLHESLRAVASIRLFVEQFIQVEKILEPLRVTKQHPLEAVYLIRFGHELRDLKAFWLGLLDGAEATLRQELADRKTGNFDE